MTLDKLQFLPEPRPALEWAVALLGCDPMVGLWGESLLCQARPRTLRLRQAALILSASNSVCIGIVFPSSRAKTASHLCDLSLADERAQVLAGSQRGEVFPHAHGGIQEKALASR